MRHRVVLCAVYTVLALFGLATVAQATCSLPGKWRMVVFASNNGPGTFAAGSCPVTISVLGVVKNMSCPNVSMGASLDDTRPVGGKLKANAKCEVTGTLTSPGSHDTTIFGGYANETMIVLAGARDDPAIQVRMVILMKDQ